MSYIQPSPAYPPASAPTPSPVFAGSPPPAASRVDPYALSMISTEAALPAGGRRGASYYVLLGVAALALFAISMFVTILLLR